MMMICVAAGGCCKIQGCPIRALGRTWWCRTRITQPEWWAAILTACRSHSWVFQGRVAAAAAGFSGDQALASPHHVDRAGRGSPDMGTTPVLLLPLPEQSW